MESMVLITGTVCALVYTYLILDFSLFNKNILLMPTALLVTQHQLIFKPKTFQY